MLSRRKALIGGLTGLFVAPAIVRAKSLMKIKPVKFVPSGMNTLFLGEENFVVASLHGEDGAEVEYKNYERVKIPRDSTGTFQFPTCAGGGAVITSIRIDGNNIRLDVPLRISEKITPWMSAGPLITEWS